MFRRIKSIRNKLVLTGDKTQIEALTNKAIQVLGRQRRLQCWNIQALDNVIRFNTVGERGIDFVQRIAAMFPRVHITYSWANSDLSTNVGTSEFENGKQISENCCENYSAGARELANTVWDGDISANTESAQI